MPTAIEFFIFPRNIQHEILKKLEFKGFSRFQQSSREALRSTDGFHWKLPLEVANITVKEKEMNLEFSNGCLATFTEEFLSLPVRFAAFSMEFQVFPQNAKEKTFLITASDSICFNARKMLKSTNSRVDRMDFQEGVTCSSETFHSLFKMSKAKELNVSGVIEKELLKLPILKKIEDISISREISDEELLDLDANLLCLKGDLTAKGISSFFRQWFHLERSSFELVNIATKRNIFLTETDAIFENLPYSVIWTSEMGTPRPRAPGWIPPFPNMYSIQREQQRMLIFFGPNVMEARILNSGENYDYIH